MINEILLYVISFYTCSMACSFTKDIFRKYFSSNSTPTNHISNEDIEAQKEVDKLLNPYKNLEKNIKVVPFSNNTKKEFVCPACNYSWLYNSNYSPAYCECKDVNFPHFHLFCSQYKDKISGGCGFKFIMKTALTKDE